MSSGYGQMNNAKTEMKNIASFETPRFYEKTLTLNFGLSENGNIDKGTITFKLDRNKAMGYSLKKVLNKTINVDKTKINFKSILASPTKTVVEGSIQNILELAVDQLKGERMRPGHLAVNLIANGKVVPHQGAGMSTDMEGITFNQDYDPLPADLQTLQLKLVSFEADHDVNRQVGLRRDAPEQSIQVLGQNIEINKLYVANGNTNITITTRDGVTLSRVYLMMDGAQAELKETNADEYIKQADGTIYHTRTLCFPGTGKELQLNMQRIKYPTTVNRVVNIPVN